MTIFDEMINELLEKREPIEQSELKLQPGDPQNFKEFIGQNNLKKILTNTITASKRMEVSLPHILLFSRICGFGKTTLSKLIGKAWESECYWTTGSSLDNVQKLKNILKSVFKKENSILFIDEIHRLKVSVAENLYLPMENFNVKVILGNETITTKPFTLIGLTTQKGYLPKPLLDRFQLQLSYDDYNNKEIESIAKRFITKKGFRFSNTLIKEITNRSFLVPRILKAIIVNYINHIVGEDISPSIESFMSFCKLMQIDELGFDKYLRLILKTLSIHGRIGLGSLEKMTQIDRKSLSNHYEPILLACGFITYSKSGREITERGLAYCNRKRSK